MKVALEIYSSSSKSTNDKQARCSIIAGDRVRSLGHLSSIIAIDVIPTLQNMCQSEHVYDNEYIEQLQLHDGYPSSLWGCNVGHHPHPSVEVQGIPDLRGKMPGSTYGSSSW